LLRVVDVGNILLVCSGDAMPDACTLSDKLMRRGIHAAITPLGQIVSQIAAADGAAILLDSALIRDPALGPAITAAGAAARPVFVLRLGGLSNAVLAERALASTIRVNALGDDRGRDLSRFANVVSDHLAAAIPHGFAPGEAPGDGEAALPHAQARAQGWSWEAFWFGPLWAVYRALPLPAAFAIGFLAVAVVIASALIAGLWAPLAGLAAAWLVLSLALGMTGNAMLAAAAGRADRPPQPAWLRPAGMAGLIGVSALTAALMIASGSLFAPVASGALKQPAPRPLAASPQPANPLLIGQAGADYGVTRPAGEDGALVLAPEALSDQGSAASDAGGLTGPGLADPRAPRPNPRPAKSDDAAIVDDIFDADPAQDPCCS
jgi:hypothetical protein